MENSLQYPMRKLRTIELVRICIEDTDREPGIEKHEDFMPVRDALDTGRTC